MEKRPGRKVVAISMPRSTYDATIKRLRANRYGSMSEYIRDLIRKDEWAEWVAGYKNDRMEGKVIEETTAYEWNYKDRSR